MRIRLARIADAAQACEVLRRVLVAEKCDAVLAVGAVRDDGEITLNYVSPEARFWGVSRAILTALEAAAGDFGNKSCHLVSTETARRFTWRRAMKGWGCRRGYSVRSRPIQCSSGCPSRMRDLDVKPAP